MAEDERNGDDEHAHEEGRPRTGIRRRLGRLLNQRELAEDTREVLGGMLEMSDRAKTEAVRLVAREARNYLDELKIKEDLLELITSHSLEVQLSVHLKPLADAVRAVEEPDAKDRGAARKAARAKGKPKVEEPVEDPVVDDADADEDPVELEAEDDATVEVPLAETPASSKAVKAAKAPKSTD